MRCPERKKTLSRHIKGEKDSRPEVSAEPQLSLPFNGRVLSKARPLEAEKLPQPRVSALNQKRVPRPE
ncbi:hypothetical protein NDU88_006397 [Pleurodeles waltl]|uniref:Uncharacterized protein n=1 Tax=Pleurodeles waltl TaxID=8319 RepID=A0AAV7PLA4_PLEWA|nr:hypothetical protein NDU88_006397 [Pleurodeles waltl]